LEVFEMADKSVSYAPKFQRQMVDLVRSAASLAKEFGPTAWTIALWVRHAKRDGGKGEDALTRPEREELSRLRGVRIPVRAGHQFQSMRG
jgi:transposase-like protein